MLTTKTGDLPPAPARKHGWPWDKRPADGVAEVGARQSMPRISVITPSLNQGRFIEEAIRSVVAQQWPDVEFIIVDGGSADETLEIIKRYQAWIAHWISEPDSGQADAINKGMRQATGDIVTWLNADDFAVDGVFAAVAEAWRRNPHAIYAAPVVNFYSRGRETLIRPRGLSIDNVVQYWKRNSLWHEPGLYWSRAVIDSAGEIDTSLHYAFDYDYLVRALQHATVEYVDHVAAGFRLHDQSKSVSQSEQMMAETAAVSQRYWPLVTVLDREGFARAEFEAQTRLAFSKLLRGKRDELPHLWRLLRERPFAVLLRLASLFPTVLLERFRRLLPARYL
jgi:glycosyltransferase involved in cell wall biosynthesis